MKRRMGRLAMLVAVLASTFTTLPPTSAGASGYVKGIDVSHWQGNIAWGKVAGAGYKFAFAKATDGVSYNDPTYRQNRYGATHHGIHFGAYHFAEPGGWTWSGIAANATKQARHFVSFADPRPGNLRPVLDLERNYGISGGHILSAKQLIHWTQVWLTKVTRKVGVKPLIYSGSSTSGSFWATHMNDTRKFANEGYRLWVPHYTSASNTTVTAGNWGGQGWTFWQWSNGDTPKAPSVPGTGGYVDHDRFRLSGWKKVTIPAPGSGGGAVTPVNTASPSISGSPDVGGEVTASSGTWGNDPTSFSYAWLRCDQLGQNCTHILNASRATYTVQAADYEKTLRAAVTGTNSAGSATARSQPTTVVGDDTAPSAPALTVGAGRYTKTVRFHVGWSSPDASGAASYDVYVRSGSPDTTLGPRSAFKTQTTSTGGSFTGQVGGTYCFFAKATDEAGNVSARSALRCTTVPLDDVSLAPAGGWRRKSGAPAYFRETFSGSRNRGATLITGDVAAQHVALLATRCRYCGTVRISLGGQVLERVDLKASTKQTSSLIQVGSFDSLRSGRLVVKIVSSGKTTRIDGMAISGR